MTDEDFNLWQKKVLAIAAVVIAIVSGNAGFFINKITPEVRYDPFTGADGDVIIETIEKMERRIDRIDSEQQKMIWRMKEVERRCRATREDIKDHYKGHP